MKKIILFMIMLISFSFNIYCAKALDDNNTCSLREIDGISYCFDDNNNKAKGFQKVNGKTYFFTRINDNRMRTGMFWIDDDYYYFSEETGEMKTGKQKVGDNYYYFAEDGKRQSAFQKIDGKTYFFTRINDNRMKYGWQNIDGYFYYFNEDGSMQNSQKEIDGTSYDFTEDGIAKLTGWSNVNGKRLFFSNSYKYKTDKEKDVIDVSSYQGKVNWDKVNKAGIYGVILRIGSWTNEDSRFKENLSELKRLGIPYGIYLFSYASSDNGINKEIQFTKSMISKYDIKPTLGIYYDIEDWYTSPTDSSDLLTKDRYDFIIRSFIDSISTYVNHKYKVKVYANLYYANNKFNEYARSQIDWIAQYNKTCSYKGDYSLWQYTDSGSVDGINGYVDMNYMY